MPFHTFFWIEIFSFLLLLIILVYFIYKYEQLKNNSKRNFIAQQQFISKERQRISGEIHDDIGSGLFAIQLFADVAAKARADIKEIKEISTMINDMTGKINEIIWSTNSESDTLENLLYYIEFQSLKLFEHTEIQFKPEFPIDIPNIRITSHAKRNTYLLTKEIVYNAIKHAKASEVFLNVTISNKMLVISIKDNGIGINLNEIRQNARGLKNSKTRISELQGTMVIENYKGTSVSIKIPLTRLM